MPITKTDAERLTQNSILWDTGRGSVTGFGVRRQRRHAVFLLKYSAAGRQRWHTIGRFGALTVDEARLQAKVLLGQIAAGDAPLRRAPQNETTAVVTIADLCDRYMIAAESGAVLTRFNRPKKTSTLSIDTGRIERHIKPLIGSVAAVDLDGRKVKGLIQDITLGKTAVDVKTKKRGRARVQGGASTAARVADLLSGIMSWAVDEEIVKTNPVHGIRRFRSEAKERFLSDSELASLGAQLRAGTDRSGVQLHPTGVQIIELLCLTGCRSSEIAKLRWSEVDLDHSCLRLEDTKSGRSLRPIGSVASKILASLPRQKGCPYVFPGARGISHFQGLNKIAPRLFRSAGLDGVSCHVLRHTFASVASELGYSDGTIAGMLGHKGRTVTSRYVHRPDAALASASTEVSEEIARRLAVDARHG